jgi:hypothetical protein
LRGLFFVLLICLSAAILPAQTRPKIYPIDSEIYRAIESLYISRGLALPSSAGPWSGDELRLMLDRLDRGGLEGAEAAAWDFAESALAEETPLLKFSGAVNVELYGHANTADFYRYEDFLRPWTENRPMAALDLESQIAGFAYGFFELPMANNYFNQIITVNGRTSIGSTFLGESAIASNIILLPPAEAGDFDMSFPKRAFVAVGGPGWSVQAGRERLSWGSGESGNLLLGSQVEYHNAARMAFWGKYFKWSYLAAAYPWTGNYYTQASADRGAWDAGDTILEGAEGGGEQGFQYEQVEGLKLFLAHRLEFRIADKVGIAVSEGLMYQSEEFAIDPALFLPSMFWHNLYTAANSNSILTIEADWSPLPRLNIYGQFVMDEFSAGSLGSEGRPGIDDGAQPSGMGFLAGIKTAFPTSAGMVRASLEGAYTNPYLYLRAQDNRETSEYVNTQLPLAFIVANKYTREGRMFYLENFLGYRWGGDAVVVNANAELRTFGKGRLGINFLFMIHGTHDKWTRWSLVDNSEDGFSEGHANNPGHEYHAPDYEETPTSEHYSANYADPYANDLDSPYYRNAPYYLSALSVSGAWNVLQGIPGVKSLELYGQVDFIYIINKDNFLGNNALDIQFAAGVSYRF